MTIRPRSPSPKPYDVPGPGHYDAKDTITRDESPSYRMRTGAPQRHSLVSKSLAQLPGPGTYANTGKFGREGPQYTMGTKKGEKYSDTPGPGVYDPNDALSKEKPRATRMG